MKVRKYQEGQIFIIDDKNKLSTNGEEYKHNYLIIGSKIGNSQLSMIQGMSITSMRNKDVEMEVPIVLCNDYISYIVPYNIHSFTESDISLSTYKGCLCNSDFMTSYQFMQLLLDIYTDSLNLGLVNHDDVVERYHQYCDWFREEYKDLKEYRNKPLYTQPTIQQPTASVNTNIGNNSSSSYIVNNRTNSISAHSIHTNNTPKKKGPHKVIHTTNKSRAMLKRETEDAIKEYEESKYIDDDSAIVKKASEIDKTKALTFKSFDYTLDDLKDEIPSMNRIISNWSKKQLEIFLTCFVKYSLKEIMDGTNRWNSISAISHSGKSAKEEYIKRKEIFKNNDIEKMNDEDLKYYIRTISGNMSNYQFLVNFTGLTNVKEIDSLYKDAKSKAIKRKLVVSA